MEVVGGLGGGILMLLLLSAELQVDLEQVVVVVLSQLVMALEVVAVWRI